MAKDLTQENIISISKAIVDGKDPGVKQEDLTDNDRIAINATVESLKIAIAASHPDNKPEGKETEAPAEDGEVILPGNFRIPKGYELVGTIKENFEGGSQRFEVEDVLKTATMNVRSNNVSCVFNSGPYDKYNERDGYLEGRIIVDHGSSAYIFRKDDNEAETTEFLVEFANQISV